MDKINKKFIKNYTTKVPFNKVTGNPEIVLSKVSFSTRMTLMVGGQYSYI